MILTKKSAFEMKKNGKKIVLPKNIRQYSCTEKEYKKFNKQEKENLQILWTPQANFQPWKMC